MTDTEARVEEIRPMVEGCPHQSPRPCIESRPDLWCHELRESILLDAYTKMRDQRDAERERAERAEAIISEDHEGGAECWQWSGPRREQGERVLVSTACPICVRVLGKEQP